MKILVFGDITDPETLERMSGCMWKIREKYGADCVIANAENASFISGVSPEGADMLLSGGVDVITGGNHTMQNRLFYDYIENSHRAIRPVNYPAEVPGAGYTIIDACGYRCMVINALGKVNMEPNLDCPFRAVERVLQREAGQYDFAVLDFHAEAVGEKYVMPYCFDGRISVIFGTHTHVQTADERIFPGGCGYISDVGMCGHTGGIIGSDAECILERTLKHLPSKFRPAEGDIVLCGALFELDDGFRTVRIERLRIDL